MTPVLALDLSATKAGVALPDGSLETLTPPTKWTDAHDDPIGARLGWWRSSLGDLLVYSEPAVMVVEGYSSTPGRAGSMVRIAEVTGIARMLAWQDDLLYVEVPPATLKKFATGSGRAGKDAMIEAARARGYDPANDDESDAALLREWVLEHLEVVGG